MKQYPFSGVFIAFFLLTSTCAYAQFTADQSDLEEFRGRITDSGSASLSGLFVEINCLDAHMVRQKTEVTYDGQFWFREVPAGNYSVRVLNQDGDELASAVTSVGDFGLPLQISLNRSKLLQKPGSGTVSMRQLMHPPSKQVLKLLESGHRLLSSKHYDGAAERFEEATKDDPNCSTAHAELGVAYSMLGKWNSAEGEYRTAVALEPNNSMLHNNLGGALAALNHYDEAEQEVATALKLDPRNARAHFVMAIVLLHRHGNVSEAVSHLVAAEDTVPSAKLQLDRVCAIQHVEGCR